jgi:hypothetical protein
MLTVVIPTSDSERPLVRSLACLVPGVTAGLVRDVILADAGSKDETSKVGDVAGCRFMAIPGSLGGRLRTAAAAARGTWILFLRPGTVLEGAWVGETMRFIEQAELVGGEPKAASFRRATRSAAPPSAIREVGQALRGAFGLPRPEQGLVIAKHAYERLGGHGDAVHPESELIRSLGRRRIVVLGALAVST